MKSNLFVGMIGLTLFFTKSNAQTTSPTLQITTQTPVKMKEFSLLVRVPVTYTTEDAKSVGPQWNALLDKWKADGIYIISFAFPGESYVVAGPEKTVSKTSVISDNRRVVSNIFLRAESLEKAVALAKDFPVLPYGGTVEVREIPQRLTQSKN